MACENDKCEKYGMHHEYKNDVEIRKCYLCECDNQPERSKREDLIYEIELPPHQKEMAEFFHKLRCGALNIPVTE